MAREYVREFESIGAVKYAGKLILEDDFKGGFNWNAAGSGTDWEVMLRDDEGLPPLGCLRMLTKATSPTAGDSVAINVRPIWRKKGRVYMKMVHKLCWESGSDVVQMELGLDDGVDIFIGAVRYDYAALKFQVRSTGGTWVDISGTRNIELDPVWIEWELIVDLANERYEWFKSNCFQTTLNTPIYVAEGMGDLGNNNVRIARTAGTAQRAGLDIGYVLVKEY